MTGSVAIQPLIVHPCRARADLVGKSSRGKRAGGRYETGCIFGSALGADNDIAIVEGQLFEGMLACSAFKVIKRHNRTPHAKTGKPGFCCVRQLSTLYHLARLRQKLLFPEIWKGKGFARLFYSEKTKGCMQKTRSSEVFSLQYPVSCIVLQRIYVGERQLNAPERGKTERLEPSLRP